jgi:hAT family C-terminal dimerisation region
MARNYLAISATSAPSECVFSSGSDTKKRNMLGGDNIRRLLCLRDWGVLEEAEAGSDIEAEELNSWE